MTVHISL